MGYLIDVSVNVMGLMNIGVWFQVAACVNPEVESLVPLHVIYPRILHVVKTKQMEIRRSPESNL